MNPFRRRQPAPTCLELDGVSIKFTHDITAEELAHFTRVFREAHRTSVSGDVKVVPIDWLLDLLRGLTEAPGSVTPNSWADGWVAGLATAHNRVLSYLNDQAEADEPMATGEAFLEKYSDPELLG